MQPPPASSHTNVPVLMAGCMVPPVCTLTGWVHTVVSGVTPNQPSASVSGSPSSGLGRVAVSLMKVQPGWSVVNGGEETVSACPVGMSWSRVMVPMWVAPVRVCLVNGGLGSGGFHFSCSPSG